MDEVIALDGGRAFGLLTRAQGTPKGRAVVLFNAGLIHRMGPLRLHVHLARRLAAQGLDVVRFDMPRIGDAPAGTHADAESVVREVLDTVQAMTGARGFIVGGICSAADQGWRTALADTRVDGVLLLDGMAVQGTWFRAGQLKLMLARSPLRWPGMLLRLLRPKPDDAPGINDFRDWSTHGQFLEQAGQLLGRGVKILAFYTGGVSYYLLHPRQIDATFGRHRRDRRLEVEFWPQIDHILFSASDRARVIDRISTWAVAS
ncbi:hypothetical protein [Pseudoxanthomonas sp. PXM02]|uniref:hypothetical protein n=1 Tax=Pseudoxanthomonas sp. PXM02 TaxID=2769294 RepID=UPI00177E0255|nr:hypothetical protein [Pseudoxanthomonas sp. PXM02]MBD9479898.1 hypothetical protein [Pseudoxanthomonas sp. PXM02]